MFLFFRYNHNIFTNKRGTPNSKAKEKLQAKFRKFSQVNVFNLPKYMAKNALRCGSTIKKLNSGESVSSKNSYTLYILFNFKYKNLNKKLM